MLIEKKNIDLVLLFKLLYLTTSFALLMHSVHFYLRDSVHNKLLQKRSRCTLRISVKF